MTLTAPAPRAHLPSAPASEIRTPPVARTPDDPRWGRPALVALLAATAGLYLWGLGGSGWANSFYSAAVQAGTKSWKAFFFGSTDAANFITVDKPPGALWIMDLSARLFGVNSWSILVPEALEGVAAVWILYAAVRRWFGAGAGLLAGAVLATTPVAALMFRFNNPDALLVLLLTAAAYAMVRALEAGRTRWLILAASLVGFGFLTKMLQALLVVPAFALVYLVAAPTPLRRRVWQLLAAGGVLVVSSLWWVVVVQLIPAANRPYIGGSQNNSLWNLIFGYNGFGRLTGNEAGSVGGPGGQGGVGGSRWGATGLLRLFNADFGGQVAWLIPAALILLIAGLVLTRRAARTDRVRAALVLWGGWLVVTAVVFSLGQGIIHPYYSVALAPAIGAIVGIGGGAMWSRRSRPAARTVLAAAMAATAGCGWVLLARVLGWNPWLRWVVLVGGLVVAGLIMLWKPRRRGLRTVTAIAGVTLALAGPAAFTLATVSTAHAGAIPSAGPAAGRGFLAGGPPGAGRRRGPGGAPGGGPPGFGLGPPNPGASVPVRGAGRAPTGGGAGLGGLLNGSTPSPALTAVLEANSGHFTWVAATVGANQASGYQLATSMPVMAIGGFNGSDPSPTLAQFRTLVTQGKIHYFIGGGGGGGGLAGGAGGSSSTASQISAWVQSNFAAKTVGGQTIYDLTQT